MTKFLDATLSAVDRISQYHRTDEDGSDAVVDPGYQSGDCCKDL